jgi:hypothetical protein
MKTRQALATLLNIQVVDDHYETSHESGLPIILGKELDAALTKAVELAKFDSDCKFVIFPIESDRGDLYMEIEAGLRHQETPDERMLSDIEDPRELITVIMAQLRDCATNLTLPNDFRKHMVRVAILAVASLQWIETWIARLMIRNTINKPITLTPKDIEEINKLRNAK